VNSKAFIQKILEGGTLKEGQPREQACRQAVPETVGSLRLWRFQGAAHGDFDLSGRNPDPVPHPQLRDGGRQPEQCLPAGDERRARDSGLAAKSTSETSKWYSILGNAPLREVMQTAFGLPKSFAAIDLDQQVTVLKDKTEGGFRILGDPAQFSRTPPR
jgi:hypothetical protein